jgi:hypothetical protein
VKHAAEECLARPHPLNRYTSDTTPPTKPLLQWQDQTH